MDSSIVFRQAISVFFFLFLQVFVFRNLVLFDYAFCFIYVGALLQAPIQVDRVLLLFYAAAIGFIVDLFYDSIGIHMGAAVLMMFVRKWVLEWLKPSGGYEAGEVPKIWTQGITWYVSYVFVLCFVHHLMVFLVESSNFSFFTEVLPKWLMSVSFTFLVILLTNILGSSKERRT